MSRYLAAGLGVGSAFLLAASPAMSVGLHPPSGFSHHARPLVRLAQAGQVTGFNLQVAVYPGGKFEKWEGDTWREYSPNGLFNFVEQARGETTVMLFDATRNVYIELDIANREVRYGEAGQSFQALYPITEMIADNAGNGGQINVPATATVVDYTCDEGLPMNVQFEQAGDQSFATYSIDTSPPVRLPQVPSGSGAVYSNGVDTLSTKGLSAILEGPTGQTRCTQN